ncbi:hypothetical protein Vadar_001235 [Vaccinium darrowii]|uniref:Uncharacterized protein n=1 Tax=Vaccinium darrowii TaxID=229202 RepID=A0ACB7YBD0_9ERIC|nr:hypothetical protein Vadar_001235 [Vaccinium darrowii]
MDPSKAPKPDGMTMGFYQKYWDVVGEDVTKAVQHFIQTGYILKSFNHTRIVLIPKVKTPVQRVIHGPSKRNNEFLLSIGSGCISGSVGVMIALHEFNIKTTAPNDVANLSETFNQWLHNSARTHSDIWYTSKAIIIGMSNTFLQLFNGVIDHLKGLNQNNQFDGDIRNRFLISSSDTQLLKPGGNKRVPITHEAMEAPVPGGVRRYRRRGILKDVQDLRSMVEDVVNLFLEQTALWTLFNTGAIYQRPPSRLNLQNVKKMTLYNCSHPFFLNKCRSYNFIHKAHENRERNTLQFNRDMCLNVTQPSCNMSNWHLRILMDANLPHHHLHQPPLRSVLYDRPI